MWRVKFQMKLKGILTACETRSANGTVALTQAHALQAAGHEVLSICSHRGERMDRLMILSMLSPTPPDVLPRASKR
ncbi:MAG TPA: hypothetical protein VM074_12700 [Solimonas sp.]|nr:hypothetical protein [Solimonas sp.]